MGITHASAGSQTPGTAGIGVCWVLSRVVGAPEHRGVPVAYRMHVTARAAIFITTTHLHQHYDGSRLLSQCQRAAAVPSHGGVQLPSTGALTSVQLFVP